MNKYRNKKLITEDGKFDSTKEYNRWCELKAMNVMGYIKHLRRQVPYVVVETTDKYRNVKYIADFVYADAEGKCHVEDVKGYRKGTAYQIFIIKKKLLYATYGIEIEEI